MGQRIGALVTAAAVVAGVAAITVLGSPAPAAVACLAKPGKTASDGQHWRYRIDRANERRCWYLAAKGTTKVATAGARTGAKLRDAAGRHAFAQESDEAASGTRATPSPPVEKPAMNTAAADADKAFVAEFSAWWEERARREAEPPATLDERWASLVADGTRSAAAEPVPAADNARSAATEPVLAATAQPVRWTLQPEHLAALLAAALTLAGFFGSRVLIGTGVILGHATRLVATRWFGAQRNGGGGEEPSDLAVVLAAARRAGPPLMPTAAPNDEAGADLAPRSGVAPVRLAGPPHPLAYAQDALERVLRDWQHLAA
jgi:hypothetical protein